MTRLAEDSVLDAQMAIWRSGWHNQFGGERLESVTELGAFSVGPWMCLGKGGAEHLNEGQLQRNWCLVAIEKGHVLGAAERSGDGDEDSSG